MIKLDVQEYCHRCLDFKPEIEKPTVIMTTDNRIMSMSDTIITCENRQRCGVIHDYVQLKFINETN